MYAFFKNCTILLAAVILCAIVPRRAEAETSLSGSA